MDMSIRAARADEAADAAEYLHLVSAGEPYTLTSNPYIPNLRPYTLNLGP